MQCLVHANNNAKIQLNKITNFFVNQYYLVLPTTESKTSLQNSLTVVSNFHITDQCLERLTWLRNTSANIPPSSSKIRHTARVYMNCDQTDKGVEETLYTFKKLYTLRSYMSIDLDTIYTNFLCILHLFQYKGLIWPQLNYWELGL